MKKETKETIKVEDFKKRANDLSKELTGILTKYQIELVSQPVIKQDGTVGAHLMFADVSKKLEDKKEEDTPLSE